MAITNNNDKNISLSIGTADKLVFKRNFFDIILYGFCLYLCDKKNYNQISYSANRVLKKTENINSWFLCY